jgi:SEC-C motif
MNVRLAKPLRDDAGAYADRIGISVNALLSVALREYLDRRTPGSGSAASEPVGQAVPAAAPRDPYEMDRKLPCHCGSGRQYVACHFQADRTAWRKAGNRG